MRLGNWLREEQVYFCLRLKQNEFVEQEKGNWSQLKALGLSPGSSLYLAGVNVTKQKGFGVFNLAAKWRRKYRGWVADEGWFILTNLETLEVAIKAYQKRFDIEEMWVYRLCYAAHDAKSRDFRAFRLLNGCKNVRGKH